MSVPPFLSIAPALLCGLSWLGAGSLIPARALPGRDALLTLLTRMAAGIVTLAAGFFLVGRAGVFTRAEIVAVTLLLTPVAFLALRRRTPLRLRFSSHAERGLAGLVAAALLVDLVASTAPPTTGDALIYHLAMPHRWLAVGRIDDVFWLWQSFSPFTVEMVYAQGLAFSDTAAGALGALLALVATTAVFGFARELGADTRGALAAAAIFSLQGVVTWEATSNLVEVGLSLFTVLAAWHGLRFARAPSNAAAAWCGVFCGAAAATKYLGVPVAAVVLGSVAVVALRRGRRSAFAVAATTTVAVALPWYLKNLLATGNPVYPLYFGGRYWQPADARTFIDAARDFSGAGSLSRLWMLPADLIRNGDAFALGQIVGLWFFVFVPAVVAVGRRRERITVALACAYVLAWWFLSQQPRFLLPALAVVAAAAGSALSTFGTRPGRWRYFPRVVLVALVVAWFVPSALLARQVVPAALGLESRPAFLDRLTGTDVAFHRAASSGARTVGIAGFPWTLYYPGEAIALDGGGEFSPRLSRRAFLRRLADHRIRYLLIADGSLPFVSPIRHCLRVTATIPARYVLSRARSRSEPMPMTLFAIRRCRRVSQ